MPVDVTKQLNPAHPLYNNISRALYADPYLPKLNDLIGSDDTIEQPVNTAISYPVSGVTWGAIQGFCRNSTNWFSFDSPYSTFVDALRKWNLTDTEVATNLTPFSSMPAGSWRFSDGCCDENTIYNPVHTYTGTRAVHLTQYNTSDLSFKSTVDITATGAGAAGCGFKIGSDNLLVVGHSQTAANEYLTKVTEITKAGVFVAEYQLSEEIYGMQGITTDGTYYYISSYKLSGNINTIYRTDADFNVLAVYDPTGAGSESEGIEYYNGDVYYHDITNSPRRVTFDNATIINSTTKSTDIKVIDSTSMGESGTIFFRSMFHQLANYRGIIANENFDNDWESWIEADAETHWRVDEAERVTHTGMTTGQWYYMAYTWEKVGSNVTIKLGVDGIYRDTNTAGTWKTIPSLGLHLGGSSLNVGYQGELTTEQLILFDKVLSDAELLDVTNNNDDLYITGSPPVTTFKPFWAYQANQLLNYF